MTTSHWRPKMVAMINSQALPSAPVINSREVSRPVSNVDLWDFWPIQDRSGAIADVAGGALYMFLSAPVGADPEERHAIARIRLIQCVDGQWRDCGHLLPDDLSPGSREWSGSAILEPDGRTVTLYYTVAGRRGEHKVGYEQRLFQTRAQLQPAGPSLGAWSAPTEIVEADGHHFMRDMAGGGAIGTIKAFRDPAYFCDPKNGREYILFTGSLARSQSEWNGAVGLVERSDGHWRLREPLVSADGLNNELERPHVVVQSGRYYLFWSTQRKVFAPSGPTGPTGLYGMVADGLAGPWKPLNGSGLVLANPVHAPHQAYSWLVLPNLTVLSFADYVGLDHAPRDVPEARQHFGGAPAPLLRIALIGDCAALIP